MSALVAGTVISANYVPSARVLVNSWRRFHPDIAFRVLLVAEEPVCRDAAAAGLDVVRLGDLQIPDLAGMLARYDCLQLVTALKPAILRYLLEQGHEAVVYLDADMLVTGNLTPLLEQVAGHALCLTPHLPCARATVSREKLERSLLLAGLYNAGFVGVANRQESRQFISWWEQRLRTLSRKDKKRGYNYDQRWLDLAPSYVGDTHLVRDPGCNVGHWSIPEITVTRDGDGYRANDGPLRIFHFSGFDPRQPACLSRHGGRRSVNHAGFAPELFAEYAKLLHAAGWEQFIDAPWPWPRPAFWRRWWER